ncbi:hypothetical protein CACET_c27830 [Clostridium aceticum]|uniref:Uncharacterized protein n=1 Tax=Clostridium aceticum TaxID=84022 RepID=A0A0D8I8P4_9CLOT|nr:hypothetical protein [Clostridium aceticum]AKL96228.1 hypothetical protein CACET_c27830 [Clostridium aceticum]KJF26638.1 hypothetical protein TZ02_12270 [Clostridium aceticum]
MASKKKKKSNNNMKSITSNQNTGGIINIRKSWKIANETLYHEWWNTERGYTNIKIYGRELTKDNRNKPLDKSTDEVILYLCGHREGYDKTKYGCMLKSETFVVFIFNFINNCKVKIATAIIQGSEKESIVIELEEAELLLISSFLNSLKESDLVGKVENKAEVLKKWTEELERILIKHGDEIAVFLELYE